jgi:hypothetical protein
MRRPKRGRVRGKEGEGRAGPRVRKRGWAGVAHAGRRGEEKEGPREERGKREWAGLLFFYPFFFPFLFLYSTHSNKHHLNSNKFEFKSDNLTQGK